MSDAGEVLGELFEAVKAVRGGADLVEACFGQHVVERVLCASCQKATHVTDYTELIFNASATAVQRHLRVSLRSCACRGPTMDVDRDRTSYIAVGRKTGLCDACVVLLTVLVSGKCAGLPGNMTRLWLLLDQRFLFEMGAAQSGGCFVGLPAWLTA